MGGNNLKCLQHDKECYEVCTELEAVIQKYCKQNLHFNDSYKPADVGCIGTYVDISRPLENELVEARRDVARAIDRLVDIHTEVHDLHGELAQLHDYLAQVKAEGWYTGIQVTACSVKYTARVITPLYSITQVLYSLG